MKRCLALARQIASPREPIPVVDLVEMNFAAWEALAWDAIPRDAIDARARDAWGYQPGGESAARVAIRWQRWLDRVRQGDAETVMAMTHAGVIRVALSRAAHSDHAVTITTPIPYGAVYRLDLD